MCIWVGCKWFFYFKIKWWTWIKDENNANERLNLCIHTQHFTINLIFPFEFQLIHEEDISTPQNPHSNKYSIKRSVCQRVMISNKCGFKNTICQAIIILILTTWQDRSLNILDALSVDTKSRRPIKYYGGISLK